MIRPAAFPVVCRVIAEAHICVGTQINGNDPVRSNGISARSGFPGDEPRSAGIVESTGGVVQQIEQIAGCNGIVSQAFERAEL